MTSISLGIQRIYPSTTLEYCTFPNPLTLQRKVARKNQLVTANFDHLRTPNVRPICLPDPNKYADSKANVSAIVAGWGLVGENQGQSVILQKTNLTVVTNGACSQAYGVLGATLREDHLCAYRRGTDACQGDSGGALFSLRPAYLRRDNLPRMEIIGITSFGERCAVTGIPGGYTRVNHYLKWVMTKMTDHDNNVAEVCNGTFGTWILWFLGQ